MSLWSRMANAFRGDRVVDEIDEELRQHMAEAIEAGRNPDEVKRAFGSTLRWRERSRDIRVSARLDSLRTDVVFAWRQMRKSPAATSAAVISLALAMGACTLAFRLIDAM